VELRWQVMSLSDEDKLLFLSTEIHTDLRQIGSDLQSLLTVLKQQQQKPTPAPCPSDEATNTFKSRQSGSPEDVLRYLREMGRMIRENEQTRI